MDSHGCRTQVGLPGSLHQIGSRPGNKVSADCSYYINNKIIVLVAVWDRAGGTGSNADYHIVGFTGFQMTARRRKDIEGVWRIPFSVGPTTRTPGFAGAARRPAGAIARATSANPRGTRGTNATPVPVAPTPSPFLHWRGSE